MYLVKHDYSDGYVIRDHRFNRIRARVIPEDGFFRLMTPQGQFWVTRRFITKLREVLPIYRIYYEGL